MATLYRERHLSNEVVFDWDVACGAVSQDELITLLESDMMESIHQLETMKGSEGRAIELKKIEFLKVSIVRAKLGREMISLAFHMENGFGLVGNSAVVYCSPRKKSKKRSI